MKFPIFFCLGLCAVFQLPLNAVAQNHKIDSLLKVLQSEKEDSNKVNTLNELSKRVFRVGTYTTSDSFAVKALTLAQKINYKKGIARAYLNRGNAFQGSGDYPLSKSNYLKSVDICKEINDKAGLASDYGNLGNVCEGEGDYKSALEYQLKALAIDSALNSKEGMAKDYSNAGLVYSDESNYAKAVVYFFKALEIDTESHDLTDIGYDYANIGTVYNCQGNYPQALSYFLQCLKLVEKTGDKLGMGSAYGSIGNVYEKEGNYPEALKNQFQSLKVKQEIGYKEGIGAAYGNIGNIYCDEHDYNNALKYQLLSLKTDQEIGNKQGIATSFLDIGDIYKDERNYQEALKNTRLALKLKLELGDKEGIAFGYIGIGKILIEQKNYAEADKCLDSAIMASTAISNNDQLSNAYACKAKIDSATGNFKAAYINYIKYIGYRDSVKNDENTRKIVSEQMQYDFDKKQAIEKEEQDKKDVIAQQENKREHIIRDAFIAGFILMLGVAFLILRGYRQKQRANKLISEEKAKVEEKQKEILDSITYAKRLQSAILPPVSMVKKHFPESFILYKPKDIVSGDFYWMQKLESLNSVLIAAADCTGHGVPGAMVSVVCSNAINRIVKETEVRDTGSVLDNVRNVVLETFSTSEGEVKDGMDISFCAINQQTNILEWTGANNPLWYIHKNKLIEIAPDKQPVGQQDNAKHFTTHLVNIEKGDTIYLFTDGYADQFGGPKGKKFMYKQLKQLLIDNVQLTMEEQKAKLEKTLHDWMGNLEQVDDILIMGIRI